MESIGNSRRSMWRRACPILFCTVTAAVVMAICTMSSPLYPMNTWVDVNCFSTMGRGMLQGKVLYRDLYEQKGPLLYFLYALCQGVFPRSYFGVYLMETACFSAFLYYSGECIGLYLGNRWFIYALIPPLAAVVATTGAFGPGGSVEEMCLFMATCSVYRVLCAAREKRPVPGRDAFAIGLFASAALWIKYTLCGVYIGLALFVALYYWRGLRQAKRLPETVGWFLLGLVPITAVVLVYFIANGALRDLFQVYFYDNIFLYSHTDGGNVATILYHVVWNTYVTLWYNRLYMALALLGMLWFLKTVRTCFWETLAACLAFGSMVFFVFGGGMYSEYYGLYFASFSVFGLIALGQLLRGLAARRPVTLPASVSVALCAAVAAGSLAYTCHRGMKGDWRREKQSLPQYQFAQIIRKEEGATLLQYGSLDAGFYYAADLVPSVKYFCRLNIPQPEMWSEQDRYVREGVTDFVVVNRIHQDEFLGVMHGYSLVAESEGFYYLYQRD